MTLVYKSVILTLCVGALISLGVEGIEYVCNGQLYSRFQPENCYYKGPDPVTWSEAHAQCRRRKGWMATSLDCLTVIDFFDGEGQRLVWSGLHLADTRIVDDTNPFLETISSAQVSLDETDTPDINAPWDIHTLGQGECVFFKYHGSSNGATTTSGDDATTPDSTAPTEQTASAGDLTTVSETTIFSDQDTRPQTNAPVTQTTAHESHSNPPADVTTTHVEQTITPTGQPTTPAGQPSTPTGQPTIPARQPTTRPTGQPSTPTGQPTIRTRQPTTPAEQPTTSTEQLTTSTEQLTISTEQLTTSKEQPTTSTEQPTTPAEQSTTSTNRTTTPGNETANSARRTAASENQTTTSTIRTTTSTNRTTTHANETANPAGPTTISANRTTTSANRTTIPERQPITFTNQTTTSANRTTTSTNRTATSTNGTTTIARSPASSPEGNRTTGGDVNPTSSDPATLMEGLARRRKRQTFQGPRICRGPPPPFSFSSCAARRHFICLIPPEPRVSGIRLLNGDGETKMFGAPQFPIKYYFSEFPVSEGDMDRACARVANGGRALRLNTSISTLRFQVFIASFGGDISIDDLPPSDSDSRSKRFWVDRGQATCTIMTLNQGIPDTPTFSTRQWPCEEKLFSACEVRDDGPKEPPTPRLMVTALSQGIEVRAGQVSAPATVFRMLSGLEPLPTGQNVTLTMACKVPNYDQALGVTIYRSGLPISRHFINTRPSPSSTTGSFEVDVRIPRNAELPGAVNVMDVVQTYQCETVGLDTTTSVKSNPLFVTLSDYEILSAHIDLHPDIEPALAWEFFMTSARNLWPRDLTNARHALAEPFQGLVAAVGLLGWQIYPLSLLPSKSPVLLFYIYRQDVLDRGGESPRSLAMTETELKRTLLDTDQQETGLCPFNVTSVRVVSIRWCWSKNIVEPSTNRTYVLPRTPGGHLWQSPETCTTDGEARVTVRCHGDRRLGFQWGPIRINPRCDDSNANRSKTGPTITLHRLSKINITKENVVETIDDMDKITSRFTNVTPTTHDVNHVANILRKCVEMDKLPSPAIKKILGIVSRLNSVHPDILEGAQNSSKALNRILKSVDELGAKIHTAGDHTFLSERLVAGDLGLEVWHVANDYDQNTIIGLTMMTGGSSQVLRSGDLVSLFSPDNLDYGDAEAAILLPKEFIESQARSSNAKNVRLVMNVYDDTTLYQRAAASDTNLTLNSKVIAAQLLVDGQPVTDLGSSQVQVVFLPVARVPDDLRPNLTSCAFWDFSANQRSGGWRTDGCRYTRLQDNRDVCVCNHLTNFAVLLSYYEQDSLVNQHQLALSIVTIVGLSLSIAGLAGTTVSFLLVKKLRQGRTQQTLFHLSLALLLAWLTFLAGVERTTSHVGCILVAALLHYLILASFMWMLMEGILQWLLFVKVMNTYFTKYMVKTALTAWGLPAIPVAIVFGIDPELYKGGQQYCWMSLDAFYYGFAIPVGLIVLANLVIFLVVVTSLCRRKNMSKHSSQRDDYTVVNIRTSIICFCLLGLSWVSGFLAIGDARVVFQYLFCVTCSLQGFVIFLMMTARKKNVRQFWKTWCCCGQGRQDSTVGWGSSTPAQLSSSRQVSMIPRTRSHQSSTSSDGRTTSSDTKEGLGCLNRLRCEVTHSKEAPGEELVLSPYIAHAIRNWNTARFGGRQTLLSAKK